MKRTGKIFLLMVLFMSWAVGISAREVGEDECKSYINMFCVRCHPAQRICDGVGVKNEEQWRETVKLMAEYGNLDKDVQDRIYSCVTTLQPGSPALCGDKPKAVNTVFESDSAEKQQIVQLVSMSDGDKIFRSISPAEAMRFLQSRDDIIFLDVRTPQERSQGAIPGSTLISIFDLVKGKVPLPKNKPILLVCAVGGRSYVAGQVLSKQGYQEVYNLSGGIKAWYQAGLPIIQDMPASH